MLHGLTEIASDFDDFSSKVFSQGFLWRLQVKK